MKKDEFIDRIKCENKDQQDLYIKFSSLLDEYQKNNSFANRKFLCYLTSAIYLTYKKLYPQLSIYIPFRTKSDMSYMKNIQKEFSKFMLNTESNEPFDTSSIIKDISGIRIILDNINFSLPEKDESNELFNDPNISELLFVSHNNFHFIDEVDEYIQSSIKTGKKYWELKKSLLKKIVELTPSEFTEERKPDPSFSELLDITNYKYNYFLEHDNFPTTISDAEITELLTLLNDLRSRIHDPLQFEILRKTLPVVLENPLIKNVLKTSSKLEKESRKANGFQSIYYNIDTPFGPVEVQAQSNKAYYASTKGSAYHSGLDGKTVNIKDFFELVDPNDENDISYYLDTLDSISADSMVSPYEIPEFETEDEIEDFFKTSKGKAFLDSEKYRNMIKHIKIKDKIELLPERSPDKETISRLYQGEDPKKTEKIIEKSGYTIIDTDEFLISTALSLSPYMNICSAGHTSYTTASIHHKKIIGEFAEILRKRDSNTCLRDILIRRLEELIVNIEQLDNESISKLSPYMKESLRMIKTHEEMSNKLPKDISKKNIIAYGEKLRDMEQDNSNDYII